MSRTEMYWRDMLFGPSIHQEDFITEEDFIEIRLMVAWSIWAAYKQFKEAIPIHRLYSDGRTC